MSSFRDVTGMSMVCPDSYWLRDIVIAFNRTSCVPVGTFWNLVQFLAMKSFFFAGGGQVE